MICKLPWISAYTLSQTSYSSYSYSRKARFSCLFWKTWHSEQANKFWSLNFGARSVSSVIVFHGSRCTTQPSNLLKSLAITFAPGQYSYVVSQRTPYIFEILDCERHVLYRALYHKGKPLTSAPLPYMFLWFAS